MTFAGRVLDELLKRLTLPDELARLVYFLVEREAPPPFNGLRHLSDGSYWLSDYWTCTEDEALLTYTTALYYVLSRIPQSEGAFKVPIRQLINLTNQEYYSLHNLHKGGFTLLNQKYVRQYIKEGQDYFDEYLTNHELWAPLLNYRVPYGINFDTRFEHTHLCARSGAGKTELIQFLIAEDIKANPLRSVIVVDSQGELIPNLMKWDGYDPERLVYVSPTNNTGFNLFDVGATGDAAVGLINYVFSSILDAETTTKQTGLLGYCIRLLIASRGTIHSLRHLLNAKRLPPEYEEHVRKLSLPAQEFFRDRFHDTEYNKTKGEIAWRLDAFMEQENISRMFSHKKTEINFHDAMDAGKIVLIDTAQTILGTQGTAFFGRFFLALITLATRARATQQFRRPTFLYIDEAHDYLSNDPNIVSLFDQARKYKVGCLIAHQRLQQLTTAVLDVTKNCSIRIANAHVDDAAALARGMRCDPDFLMNQPLYHFALYVHGQATVSVKAPYLLRDLPTRKLELKPTVPPEPEKKLPEPPEDIESLNRA